MTFQSLFIRTRRSIGGIELDATLSEKHINKVSATDYPVELGVDITDHSEVEPKKLEIVAEVSDTPMGLAAFGQIIDTITGLFGSATAQNLTRSVAAYNALVLIMDAREPIEVQTRLLLYSDMLITDITVVQDKDTSRIVRLFILLKKITIVQSQIVQIEPSELQEGSPRDQASSIAQDGRKETLIPRNDVQRSVLKTVSDWLGAT